MADYLFLIKMGAGAVILIVVGILALVVLGGLVAAYFRLWLQALLSGAHVGFVNLVAMRLRKVNPGSIVDARIRAVKAGLDIDTTVWRPTSWPAATSSA